MVYGGGACSDAAAPRAVPSPTGHLSTLGRIASTETFNWFTGALPLALLFRSRPHSSAPMSDAIRGRDWSDFFGEGRATANQGRSFIMSTCLSAITPVVNLCLQWRSLEAARRFAGPASGANPSGPVRSSYFVLNTKQGCHRPRVASWSNGNGRS